MGRAPCCDKASVKKGPWSPEEDAKLKDFIEKFGTAGNWIALPQKAGLKRCGKSCRLRWLNYLRPNIKHGHFSEDEDTIITSLYANIGSRWSVIAAQLPGRTDNDIKNYWNTKLKKKLIGQMISSDQSKLPPPFSTPQSQTLSTLSHLHCSIFYNQASKNLNSNFIYCNSNFSSPPSFTAQYPYYQQNQESLMDLQYYPIKDNMLMFNEASSSSDGSCSQISYGKDNVKQEEMGFFQGLISNGLEENHKFRIDNPLGSYLDQTPNRYPESSELQYDIEEVKKLITTANDCNNNLVFSGEKERSGERGMYYYY